MPSQPTTVTRDDSTARERIAGAFREGQPNDISNIDIDTNLVVRAAAGTGKTTALVGRMVALVRRGVPIDQIVAITFTRKAAGEMKARFFQELLVTRDALGTNGHAKEHRRVGAALDHIEHCFIDTIDAFCTQLLRARPLEAGVPPSFELVDPADEPQLRRETWDAYVEKRLENDPEWLDRLQGKGVELDHLYDLFGDVLDVQDLPKPRATETPRPDVEAAADKVVRFVEEWQVFRRDIDAPADRLHEDADRDKVMQAFDDIEHYARLHGFVSEGDYVWVLNRIKKAKSLTLNRWQDKNTDKEIKKQVKSLRDEALPALLDEVVGPVLAQWEQHLYPQMLDAVWPAVDYYRDARVRQGRLTFQDVLLYAAGMLREHADVRAYFERRYRYFLVDEFQDTDPIQAELLFYLTGDDASERDWRRCRPRPGSLFIVGDDKQSIYRFRRADLSIYEEVCSLVDRCGGEVVELTRNFRSLAPLCRWFDDTFGPLYEQDRARDEAFQARYANFAAHRPAGHDRWGLRQLKVNDIDRNPPEQVAQDDADQIARIIKAAHERGMEAFGGEGPDAVFDGKASYGDFLILTRKKKHLALYAEALTRYGVPYVITGSDALGASEELRCLVDLMACIHRPDDAVAQLAFLRGLLCGAGDDALFRYRKAREQEDAYPYFDDTWVDAGADAAVPDGLSDDDDQLFRQAYRMLERTRHLFREQAPSTALRHLLVESGLLASASRAPLPSSRAGNLLRVVAVVRAMENQGRDWIEIFRELQRLVDGETTREELTLETGSPQAVRLMNVHQAKGLEARVVFLADPLTAVKRSASRHVSRHGDEPFSVVPAMGHGDGFSWVRAAPAEWQEYEELEQQYEEAEETRLLYVAATRARNLLVVSRYDIGTRQRPWGALTEAMDEHDVPHLTAPDDIPPREHTGRGGFDAEALEELRRERRARAAQPRVEHASPSLVHEATDDFFEGRDGGYGMDYGTAVHALFEQVIQRRMQVPSEEECASMARRLLDKHIENGGSSDDVVRHACAAVDALLRSTLWQQITAAEAVCTEVPLGWRDDAPQPPRVYRGTVDLAYRSDGTWTIVDFKTDQVSVDNANTLIQQYGDQLRIYANAWHAATGEEPAEVAIWATETAHYVPVPAGR